MTDNHAARLSSAQVETIAGFSGGTISTLAVHPLDVIKTRLHIARASSSRVTSLGILRSLIANPQPIQSLYRGLTPNLIGNSTSWALFFYFKSLAEDQLLLLHNGISGTQKGYELRSGDYLLSSGVSGTFVTLSTNPIWVVKTRMLSSDKGAEGAYKNMWHGARQVFQHEGWKGFYRGAGVSLLGNTHGAVQFAVYEPMKKAWRRYLSTSNPSTHVNPEGRREEKLSNTALLVMSGAAKVFAGTATYPYQVIRSRLQTYESEKRFGKGIKGVVERIWREDGVKGFYRGLGPNIVKVLPSTWATFLVYENVKYYLSVWAADDDVSAVL